MTKLNFPAADPDYKSTEKVDLHDWQSYMLSLSIDEHKMKSDAMLNVRVTERYIGAEITGSEPGALSDQELGSRLRMLTRQVSQLEHWSFETLRYAKRLQSSNEKLLKIIIGIVALQFIVALIALYSRQV